MARHFIAKTARQYGLAEKPLHPDTLHWLIQQDWPGNVRELENTLQRAFLLAEGPSILIRGAIPKEERRIRPDRRRLHQGTLNFNEAKREAVAAFEQTHLRHLMEVSGGNVSQAARLAGKERRALGKLLKTHGIEPSRFRQQ